MFPSTTHEWRPGMVRRRRQAQGDSAAKPLRSLHGRVPWPRRKAITLTVKYRGGPEAWVEIHARGGVLRVPGYVCIIDVMAHIWRDE